MRIPRFLQPACLLQQARLAAFAAIFALTPVAHADDAALPVAVPAKDSAVRYIGRFDVSNAAGPQASWSNSEVELSFKGTAVNFVVKAGGGGVQFEKIIDGKDEGVLPMVKGQTVYSVAADLPDAPHVVELVKRTEAMYGSFQVLGFQLSAGGQAMKIVPSDKRIEVIGDSISCGYGNEGKSQGEHFSTKTQNAYMTYGAITARNFGAEYDCEAWSGRTLTPTNTIPEIYDRIRPEAAAKWDFKWQPQAVLINLGTNDFRNGNPDEAIWTAAYEKFVTTIRKNYPKAHIYLATSPMMSDGWPPNQHALSTLKKYLADVVGKFNDAGDKNVHEIDFDPQDQKNGLGADWHPSIKTHEIMAEKFTAALATDLGWKPVTQAAPEN